MQSLLIRSLTKLSSKVQQSQTTNSIYFYIGSIKVRVSDHMVDADSYDLAIIKNIKGYTLIPNIGKFKKIEVVKNLDSVIKYIIHFNYFHQVFLGCPITKVDNSIVDTDKQKQQFLNLSNVKGWTCTNLQPENLTLVCKLYDYYNQKGILLDLLSTFKQYGHMNANQKHDFLAKLCSKLGI